MSRNPHGKPDYLAGFRLRPVGQSIVMPLMRDNFYGGTHQKTYQGNELLRFASDKYRTGKCKL